MSDYPINYHVLAEDFRQQAAGVKEYNQGDGEWLHASLSTMCAAYDELVEKLEEFEKAMREAPMPEAESVFGGEKWADLYDEWWHRHASEEALQA